MWYLKCSIAAGMWISIFTPVRVEKGFGAIHCQYVPVSHWFFLWIYAAIKWKNLKILPTTGPSWHMQESNAACRSPSLIGKLDFSKTLTTNLFQCAIRTSHKIAPKKQHYTHSALKLLICKTSGDCVKCNSTPDWFVLHANIRLHLIPHYGHVRARADGQSYVLFHAFVLFERDLHILWVHHPSLRSHTVLIFYRNRSIYAGCFFFFTFRNVISFCASSDRFFSFLFTWTWRCREF